MRPGLRSQAMPSAQTSPAIVALTVTRPVPCGKHGTDTADVRAVGLYPSGQNTNYKFPGGASR